MRRKKRTTEADRKEDKRKAKKQRTAALPSSLLPRSVDLTSI